MSRFPMFPRSRRMMSCRRVGQELQAYLDHEVDDLTTRRIARHLDDCRRCGMELAVYQEIKGSLVRKGGSVDHDALERLRTFGERLAHDDPAAPETQDETPSG